MDARGSLQKTGVRVPARTRDDIRLVAHRVRDELICEGLGLRQPNLPLIRILEALQYHEVIEFEVMEDHELGSHLADADPDRGVLRLRNEVYVGADAGEPFYRSVIAHELGHLFLHQNCSRFGKSAVEQSMGHAAFEDSEWQAQVFAGELLVDVRLLEPPFVVQHVMRIFGVSYQMASYQIRQTLKK